MDTSVLIIIGTVLSILMLIIAVLNSNNSKSQNERVQDEKNRTVDKELSIQNAKLEVDIQYIKSQLTNIQTLITTNNNDYKLLKKEMYDSQAALEKRMTCIETNCQIIQSKKGE